MGVGIEDEWRISQNLVGRRIKSEQHDGTGVGIATDQLALSVQEIPSRDAMEMGQILQAVGHK
jgi:hypothetical protein